MFKLMRSYNKNYYINKIILSILILVALFLNVKEIEFIYGITFNFSSIIILLIFRIWGYKNALVSSIIVYILSTLIWKNPVMNIVLILEVLVIKTINTYRPKWNMIINDILFWICIGLVLNIIVYKSIGGGGDNSYLAFITAKNIINGVFNAIVVDVIISYIPIKRWILRESKDNFLIHFRDLIFHILIIAVMIPFIVTFFINSLNSYDNMQVKTEQLAQSICTDIESVLSSWSEEDINKLVLGDIIKIGYLTEIINNQESKNQCEILITNSEGKNLINKNRLEVSYSDGSDKDKYSKSNFEILKNKIKVEIKIPIDDYKESVYDDNVNQIRLIVLFSLFIVGGIMVINKYIFKGIGDLAIISSSIADHIEKVDYIKWPSSNVVEIRSLTDNFKGMAYNLRKKFIESKHLNNTLENQKLQLIESKEKLKKQAYYDMLTGLPNRLNFKEYLHKVKSENIYDKVAVIFMDMNHFKQINDSLGHDTGDQLLVMIAERMSEIIDDNSKVFRLGGDEFVVVVTHIEMIEVERIGNKIIELLKENFIIDKREFSMTASLGASIYPDDSKDIASIIKYADIAMYRCKENGGSYLQIFNDKIKQDFMMKYTIEKEIILALRNKEIELHYQPKIRSSSNEVSSLEALLRWNSKKMGYIPPDVFIPIAEESELISIIDKFVLFEACKTIKEIHQSGFENICMAINISAGNFTHGNLIKEVKEALAKYKIEPKYLKIEITEGVLIKNIEKAIDTINELKEIGVSVSIDDFGRGFSSFSQLINLPISELKIDRDFITNVDKNDKKAMIVKLIIELAHGLQLNTVAEGIETEEEGKYLREFGCDELQGYLYCKALNKEKLINFLNNF